jgi:hypothetical protein
MDQDAPEIEVLNLLETVTTLQVSLRLLSRSLDDFAEAVSIFNAAMDHAEEI